MELVVLAKISQKSKIDYNKEEIEKGLAVIEEKYKDITFTEEQLGEAKEERAKLNKLVGVFKEYRSNIISEAMTELKPFEDFMKEAEKRAKSLSDNIADQVKKFEENLKIERLTKVTEYLEALLEEKPRYAEFKQQLAPSLDNAVFTNKGSFTAKGEIGTKIKEYIETQLSQFDEILKAREEQAKIMQQKRDLIIQQCSSLTDVFGLKIPLSPKSFDYLKDYDLSAITGEIQRAAKEQQEAEKEAVRKIEEEATRKAQEELSKPQEKASEPQKEVLEVKHEEIPTQEVKTTQKLFYGVLEFDGITVDQARAFKKFLDDNDIEYKVIKQEVR